MFYKAGFCSGFSDKTNHTIMYLVIAILVIVVGVMGYYLYKKKSIKAGFFGSSSTSGTDSCPLGQLCQPPCASTDINWSDSEVQAFYDAFMKKYVALFKNGYQQLDEGIVYAVIDYKLNYPLAKLIGKLSQKYKIQDALLFLDDTLRLPSVDVDYYNQAAQDAGVSSTFADIINTLEGIVGGGWSKDSIKYFGLVAGMVFGDIVKQIAYSNAPDAFINNWVQKDFVINNTIASNYYPFLTCFTTQVVMTSSYMNALEGLVDPFSSTALSGAIVKCGYEGIYNKTISDINNILMS